MNLILRAIKSMFRKQELQRPCYDTRRTDAVELIFDGNMEGKETIQANEFVSLVKISAEPFPVKEAIGASGVFYDNGETFSGIVTEESIFQPSEQLYVIEGAVFVAFEDTTFDGITLTKGVWFCCEYDDAGALVFYPTSLTRMATTGELKKLDEKYLPDSAVKRINKAQATADKAQATADKVQAAVDNASPVSIRFKLVNSPFVSDINLGNVKIDTGSYGELKAALDSGKLPIAQICGNAKYSNGTVVNLNLTSVSIAEFTSGVLKFIFFTDFESGETKYVAIQVRISQQGVAFATAHLM